MNQVPNLPQGYHQQRKYIRNERELLSDSLHQASIEQNTAQSYRPPAVTECSFLASSFPMSATSNSQAHPYHSNRGNRPLTPQPKPITYVTNPSDGSILMDHNNKPVSVDKLLATKPLRKELSTRPGPGNKKLTYISGDGISRTLNDIFGFDGWNLDIVRVERVESLENQGKHTVIYTAHVRLTHKASGTYKEDVGMGDSTDRSFATAVGHAIKASITDAMKRAARHFGDKLGNSLYESSFNINNAPKTLQEALDRHDIERCKAKFGFPKDRNPEQPTDSSTVVPTTVVSTTTTVAAPNAPTSNPAGQTRTSPGAGENKSITSNPESTAANPYQAHANQGNRVPLSNLSANAKPMPAPHQQGKNFPFTPMPTSNSNSNPPGQQQVRQPAPTVNQSGHQQPNSGGIIRQGAPNATSSNTANANRCNSSTVIPQARNTYSNANSTNRTIIPPAQPNGQQTAPNLPIAPPPTATDTLKNSNLFSCPSQPNLTVTTGTSNTPTIGTTAPPSRRGRFSMDGQNPIQQAPLVTPTNSHYSNTVKRPTEAVDMNMNKRPCRPNNPYASTTT